MVATRAAASSSRSSGRRPDRTASEIASTSASTVSSCRSWPRQSASTPAASASTAASSTPTPPLIARISSASVTTSPSKPSSSRSSPVRIRAAQRGGQLVEPGTSRCAGHHRRTPASIAARNGGSAVADVATDDRAARGASRPAVSPCPGKCFAQAATPCRCSPATKAATCRATSSGSAPKERTPITGLCGIRVHVRDGREVQVRRRRAASSPAIAAATSLGQLDVVDDAEREVPG